MKIELTMRLLGKAYHPESLRDAGNLFCTIQDELLKSNGTCMKGATVTTGGKFIAHISQNGSVWLKPGNEWKPGDKPIYKRKK